MIINILLTSFHVIGMIHHSWNLHKEVVNNEELSCRKITLHLLFLTFHFLGFAIFHFSWFFLFSAFVMVMVAAKEKPKDA